MRFYLISICFFIFGQCGSTTKFYGSKYKNKNIPKEETSNPKTVEEVLNPPDLNSKEIDEKSGDEIPKYLSGQMSNLSPKEKLKQKTVPLDLKERPDLNEVLSGANVIRKGTPITIIVSYSCIKESKVENRSWLTKNIDLKKVDPDYDVLSNEFVFSVELSEDMELKQYTENVESDSCVVLADIDINKKAQPASVKAAQSEKYQDLMGYSNDVREKFSNMTKLPNAKRVKVGVIDTGIDMADFKNPTSLAERLTDLNPEFHDVVTDLRLTNTKLKSDNPEDKQGHGTQMASIIGSKTYGLAHEYIQLIPLKLTDDFSSIKMRDAIQAITVAVNLGVEVLNISLGTDDYGCSPLIGYTIYRAIEKGVFFTFSAGNGIQHVVEHKVGYPVTAANDDGPLNFQRTQVPACWGKYFLGAVAVGAIDQAIESQKEFMPIFSNYGEDVELVAPGQNIEAIGLNGKVESISGTSASAAFVTSAAAIAMYHHKVHGFKYSPWYIENLLVESSRKSNELIAVERRSRFGSVLSMAGLANLLTLTEVMTEEQRQNIPTINPRYREGWLPGNESNLDRLKIVGDANIFNVGDIKEFDAFVSYKHDKKEESVKSHINDYWFISFDRKEDFEKAGASKNYFEISDDGKINFSAENFLKLNNQLFASDVIFKLLNVYDEDQHQVYNIYPFTLKTKKGKVIERELKIILNDSSLKVGNKNINFILEAEETVLDDKGNRLKEKINVTGSTIWSSNNSIEFRPLEVPGTFSAEDARFGQTYTVTAKYEDQMIEKQITLQDEVYQNYIIHSHLGKVGNYIKGQMVTLESIIQTESSITIFQKADWFLDEKLIANQETQIKLDLDKTPLTDGPHQLKTKAKIKLKDKDMDVVATFDFQFINVIDRIEIHLKDPVVSAGADILLNVRAYFNSNSYQIVTESVAWEINPPNKFIIQESGKAGIPSDMAGVQVSAKAKYGGKEHQVQFVVIDGSSVTGAQSELVDIKVENIPAIIPFNCKAPPIINPIAIYADGQKRPISVSSSLSIFHDGVLTENPTIFGGDKGVISFAYNDGSIATNGGGSVIKSQEFYFAKADTPIPTISSDKIIYFQRPKLPIVWSQCMIPTEVSYPDLLNLWQDSVYKGTIAPGTYHVKLDWDWNGNGTTEHHTISYPFQIVADTFKRILVYGTKETAVTKTIEQTYWPLKHEDSFVIETNRNLEVNSINHTFSASDFEVLYSSNVTQVKSFLSSSIRHVISFCFDPMQVTDFWIQDKFLKNNTVAKINFQASLPKLKQFDYSAVIKNIPDTNEIPISTKVSTFCNNENRKLKPFAGGMGYVNDPFRICSLEQFNAIHQAEKHSFHFKLEDHLDFQGQRIEPIDGASKVSVFDGNNFEIKNFVFVDSERRLVGLFAKASKIINLGIRNATIKGGMVVGGICGECERIENSYITQSSVSAQKVVGGLVGDVDYMLNVKNDRTPVYAVAGDTNAGGVAGIAKVIIINAANNSDVVFIGVAGGGGLMGGIAGYTDMALNIKNTGNIIHSGGIYGAAGGLFGSAEILVYGEFSGNIVNQGPNTGGAIGITKESVLGSNLKISNDGQITFTNNAQLQSGNKITGMIAEVKVTGSVWGGMSKKEIVCQGELIEVLGAGGDIDCSGFVISKTGGASYAGGILGYGSPILINNQFGSSIAAENKSVVRGVSEVGGITGHMDSLSEIYNNKVFGKVSISNPNGIVGKIFGYMKVRTCGDFPLSKTKDFINGNTYENNQQNDIEYAVGMYEHTAQQLRLNFSN